MTRRLATIMAADVVGYSALAGAAEEDTLRRLDVVWRQALARVEPGGGRVFARAGDGFLAEFASPVEAVRAAFDLQRDLALLRRTDGDGLHLRIGVHLADVVTRGADLLGDGVNIAARIESAAAPDSVTVSAAVFEQVKRTAKLRFEDLGEVALRNISEPAHLYRVVDELGSHSCITGSAVPSQPDGHTIAPRENGIAVLPFANLSGDPEQDCFADGFSEDLITDLARFRDLFVLSRNASFALKGRSLDPREAAESAGVAFCLEGSVRRLGPRVRITAQLTRAATGEEVWADRFDCALDELFDVQDAIAARIVAKVAGQIESAAVVAARSKRPADMTAWECLVRGLEYHRIGGVTAENCRTALTWFDRAVKADPGYGRAYAWRACAAANLWEWTRKAALWEQCLADGRRGVELDDGDAECHRIAGSIALYERRYEAAEHHFHRALELNPNHVYVVGRVAELYNFMGQPARALEWAGRARALDPFLPEYCRELEAVAHYLLDRPEETRRVVATLTRLTRRAAVYATAAAVRGAGDPAEAACALLRLDPDFRIGEFLASEFYRDRATVDRLADELHRAGLAA